MFPNEIYVKILKYIPYENLYGNIRLVNHQFSQIASEIIEKYDLGLIYFNIDFYNDKLIAKWASNYKCLNKSEYVK
uniref:F-box domain-containing protein n=1 Tax=Meloidogyne hapla TaxID=6305 RepID=A0A1I8B7G5_MELHA